MKKIAALALCWVVSLPLFGQAAGDWLGYVTYTPNPVVTKVGFDAAGLQWLNDIAAKVGAGGFTFLGRRDGAHWIALTTTRRTWILQVHDETARFNFRGLVSPKTGRLTVEKGVSWEGLGKQADAVKAATLALEYADKARISKDLFAPEQMKAAPAPTKATPKVPAVPGAANDKAPPMKPSGPVSKAPMNSTPTTPATMMPTAMTPLPMAMGPSSPADSPWQKLVDGNLRFVSGRVVHPDQSMARVEETARGQRPFAIVVSCSDSAVPPEVVFDQGLGDLFVIRTAGEVVTDVELGSIEYAVETLGIPYVVVMGEKGCGIVDMTLKGGDLPVDIEAVAAQIRPAVETARFLKGDLLDNTVRQNTQNVVAKIKSTPALAQDIRDGKLDVKAAYYDTATGKVAALP
jgi:carbonic anhydrase